jgi:hypothetical protein
MALSSGRTAVGLLDCSVAMAVTSAETSLMPPARKVAIALSDVRCHARRGAQPVGTSEAARMRFSVASSALTRTSDGNHTCTPHESETRRHSRSCTSTHDTDESKVTNICMNSGMLIVRSLKRESHHET